MLVGTSLVAKGLDIPEVTLVGIVSADVALTLPDERAAERTYQLLVQAIGRAGRGARAGRAVVQTYQPEHPAIRAVVEGRRGRLLRGRAPPRSPLGRRRTGPASSSPSAWRIAMRPGPRQEMAEPARPGRREPWPVVVPGPAPAYVPRRAGRWRFNVILRGPDPRALSDGDPGLPWSVDVDPESLLCGRRPRPHRRQHPQRRPRQPRPRGPARGQGRRRPDPPRRHGRPVRAQPDLRLDDDRAPPAGDPGAVRRAPHDRRAGPLARRLPGGRLRLDHGPRRGGGAARADPARGSRPPGGRPAWRSARERR